MSPTIIPSRRWHLFHSWATIRTGLTTPLWDPKARGWLQRCRVCGKERAL